MFLQDGFDLSLQTNTLKVHVSALFAILSVSRKPSISHQKDKLLHPPKLHIVPSWDLSIALDALMQVPFEPVKSVSLYC